ncbi:hypothetical protein GYMLUDRAFT_263862 [Collybiopsis luxurians FD-317 M1]|uniref:NB-ARC domain-containing protein n=1 Tax=Collybiopsis luxurians FD-317 M1 TaxID=944289 RepID=A0A0D0AZM6_9AGAR|nr:hypothetical protein GYMLUDRAFT_263862 [Collybiopsis luxurians FD-317 M1]
MLTPPEPDIVIGRDMELKEIVDALLNRSPPPIAIMGFGGMGKTTLASKIFHNSKIKEKYNARYFVSCEGVLNIDQFWTKLAIAFLLKLELFSPGEDQLMEARKMAQIQNQVVGFLKQGSTMLCLDNFETLWESTKGSDELQEVLKRLNVITPLGLILTMRGTQGPGLIDWKILTVVSVTLNDSIGIFRSVVKKDPDENSMYLLKELAGIPLAIHLFAAMVKDGHEGTESIKNRWETVGTSIIERGEEGRLSQLDFSIHISVDSHRITPEQKVALIILAYLPTGLKDGTILKSLDALIPNFHNNLRKLQRQALTSLSSGRFEMLPPIARYCKEHLKISKELENQLKEESTNIRSILMFGCQENVYGEQPEFLIEACIKYTRHLLDSGLQPDQGLIQAALQLTSENKLIKAKTWKILGEIQYQQYQIDKAVSSFEEAINNYESGDILNIDNSDYASACLWLGMVYIVVVKYSESEKFSHKALVIFQQENNKIGEASSFGQFGDLYYYMGRLEDAKEALDKALALYNEISNQPGQAISLRRLGDLYMKMNKTEDAQEALNRALALYENMNISTYQLGQANSLLSLGDIYMRTDKLEDAQEALKKALSQYEKISNQLGLANSLWGLGNIYMKIDKFEDAKEAFDKALAFYEEISNQLGQANSLQSLGDLYLRMHKLEDALEALNKALAFYEEITNQLGQANCLKSLGDIYMRTDKLEDAQEVLNKALAFYEEISHQLGQANSLRRLGDLYMRMDKLEDTQETLNKALVLYEQISYQLGQANTLKSFGDLYIRMNRPKDAQEALNNALTLYKEITNLLGQANSLRSLGDLYMKMDKLEDAQETLDKALALYEDVSNLLGQANSLQSLGDLYMRMDKLDDAQEALNKVLALYEDISDQFGQAGSLQSLGYLYMRVNRPEDAQEALNKSLACE